MYQFGSKNCVFLVRPVGELAPTLLLNGRQNINCINCEWRPNARTPCTMIYREQSVWNLMDAAGAGLYGVEEIGAHIAPLFPNLAYDSTIH